MELLQILDYKLKNLSTPKKGIFEIKETKNMLISKNF